MKTTVEDTSVPFSQSSVVLVVGKPNKSSITILTTWDYKGLSDVKLLNHSIWPLGFKIRSVAYGSRICISASQSSLFFFSLAYIIVNPVGKTFPFLASKRIRKRHSTTYAKTRWSKGISGIAVDQNQVQLSVSSFCLKLWCTMLHYHQCLLTPLRGIFNHGSWS